MSRVCCFTGYRPHRFSFSPDGLRPQQVRAALTDQIRCLYEEGYRTFISGMSTGVDLWAAAAVVDLAAEFSDLQLVAAVPFEGQESRWPLADRREYRRVLDACHRVEVLYDRPATQEEAAACYRNRNRWMVDRADTVLAVCPVDVADSRTGTAATVRYARKQQRRILYIHPQTLAVTEETVQQIQFPME